MGKLNYIIVNGNVSFDTMISHEHGNVFRVISLNTGESFTIFRVFRLFYVNRQKVLRFGTSPDEIRDIHVVSRLWHYPFSFVALRLALFSAWMRRKLKCTK